MNASQLLNHFDRISEAPDAIPRLRRFILDLAVRGKMVEQNPNDEFASKLFDRIQTQICIVLSKGRKRVNIVEPVDSSSLLFEIPTSWKWIRLGQVSTLITKGSTPTSYGRDFVELHFPAKSATISGFIPATLSGAIPATGSGGKPATPLGVEWRWITD